MLRGHAGFPWLWLERDPANPAMDPSKPIRDLNRERRSVASTSEQQRLIAEGWYTAGQFGHVPLGIYGERYLTNEYQYVTLRLMHNFALGQHGGAHEPLALKSFGEADFATYRVPAELEDLAQHLESEAASKGRAPTTPAQARERAADGHLKHPNGTPPTEIACRSLAETRWLRNKYLHRSAQTLARDHGIGMAAREDRLRLVIPDDEPRFVPPSLAGADTRPPAVPAW